MKLTPVVAQNVKRIAFYNLGLTAMENGVFFVLRLWNFEVLAGSLLGYVASVVSFLWLGISVQKAMEKEQKQAQIYMQSRYTARMAMFAVVFAAALFLPVFNWVAAIIPFVFTRISVAVISLINREG